ncbi:MAG: undecaprenyl-diphosphatase, partial [Planctomycetes bacterium]|nr:undecaprenyl-diphosphatase [Planctomycetota bacterium]
LLCEDWIDSHLFNNYTVAVALVVGGVALIALEWWQRRAGKTEADLRPMEGMSLRQAFVIGLFQCLALVPGTSRSAATIAGALVLGFQRTVAAEFSFLVGLPLLYGACGVKLLGKPEVLAGGPRTVEFAVGSAVAFLSALLVVGPFVRFLRRHTFVPFGVYRIIAGALLLALVRAGVVSG